jgi:hypothetical protein
VHLGLLAGSGNVRQQTAKRDDDHDAAHHLKMEGVQSANSGRAAVAMSWVNCQSSVVSADPPNIDWTGKEDSREAIKRDGHKDKSGFVREPERSSIKYTYE